LDTWTLGPLVLQKGVLIIAAVILTCLAAIRLFMRRQPDAAKGIADRTLEALFIWLVVWKLSVLLFDPQSVLSNPRALLYFNGGVKGAWIAGLIAFGYVWYREHKSPQWLIYMDTWLVCVLTGYPVYRILKHIYVEGNTATDILLVLLCGAILAIRFRHRTLRARGRPQQLLIAFVIGHALISTLAANTWENPQQRGEQAQAGTGIRVGQQAPDFELSAPGGDKLKLSDYRGKKVLVNFWATWCPPCQVEMPHMQQFYSEYKDRGVVILSVNATKTEVSQVVVNSFIKYWALTFPVVLDSLGEVGDVYKVNAYPATYVIDEQGIIRDKIQGPMNQEMLRQAVK
jgi:peroxiredoxin